MIKAFIITQEEPFYIPKVIRHLLESQGSEFQIIGCTILKPHRKNKTMNDWFMERFRIYTWWELLLTALLLIRCKILQQLFSSKNTPYSVNKLFKKFNITEIKTNDINSIEYLNSIKSLQLDTIISISPPQIFGKELLKIPGKYCINAHGTLLPRHRGVFGSWWTLYCNDQEAGTTIHTMVEKLDAGEIIWQQSFPVMNNDTQYSIAYKTKEIMAFGLVETLKKMATGNINKKQATYESSYHKAPTTEQAKEFHKMGKRIIKRRDFQFVLAKSFGR